MPDGLWNETLQYEPQKEVIKCSRLRVLITEAGSQGGFRPHSKGFFGCLCGASAQEHEHRDVEVLLSWCWQLAGEESLNRFGQWARMLRTRVTENRNFK